MSRRELILAVLVVSACAPVVIGIALISPAVAWIAGGVLGAVWSWLVFGEIG